MPRKKRQEKYQLDQAGDSGCFEIAKLVNLLMVSGKKAKAEGIVKLALKAVDDSQAKAVEIFLQAVENVKPVVEVRPRRVGGAHYKVPVELKPLRRTMLALRWLKDAAKQRKEKTMVARLCGEVRDASEMKGIAVKRRDELHRLAESNKAFSHFRLRT